MKLKDTIALDSQRSIDESGHLRIAKTVLSKAGVNPYFGREIPNHIELGLEPDRVYHLLRDPGALEQAADTFKGKQLLIKHEYVDSEDVKKDITVGAVGSNVEYVDGTVYGDITVWDAKAIELIDTEKLRELSASYWYRAKMTQGVYKDTPYDGIMLDIRGNHVALVARGRIGRDAIISDSLPFNLEFINMNEAAKQKITAKLQAVAKAGIAKDEDIENVIREVADNIEHKPAFDDVKLRELAGDNYDEIIKLVGGKTADDETPKKPEGGADKPADDEDKGPKAEAERKELETTDRDDRDAIKNDKKETAMDADAIAADVQAKVEAKFRARDQVEPLVGRIALDGFANADAVYAYALKQKGIACDGVNTAGLEQLVAMAANQTKTKTVAQDAAPVEPSKLTERFKRG